MAVRKSLILRHNLKVVFQNLICTPHLHLNHRLLLKHIDSETTSSSVSHRKVHRQVLIHNNYFQNFGTVILYLLNLTIKMAYNFLCPCLFLHFTFLLIHFYYIFWKYCSMTDQRKIGVLQQRVNILGDSYSKTQVLELQF